MADALASFLVEQLAAVIKQEIQQKVRLVRGVQDEVKKLKATLTTIQEVLNEAEHRQIQDKTMKRWLTKFKIVAHDMDNLLDEWRTMILITSHFGSPRNVNGDDNDDGNDNNNKKVLFSYSCLPFLCFNKVALYYDIGSRIKEIRERLDEIRNEKDEFEFFGHTKLTAKTDQAISSMAGGDNLELEGRDSDKSIILQKLLSETSTSSCSSCNQRNNKTYDLRIVSIIGMGGIGKTSLAQTIYDNDQVKVHFEKRMWVYVSEPFDHKMVARAIIQEASGNISNSMKWNPLHRELCESVKEQRFLLVLDNLWTDDEDHLYPLMGLLRHGAEGSRIMVTTRKQSVAKRMNSDQHHLGLLSTDECWLLISRKAFIRGTGSEKVINDVGYEIAKKCNGLPLTASIVGSILRMQMQIEREWCRVLESMILESEELQEKLLIPLLLSYGDLQPPLKRCFAYCAIFPKGHRIKKHTLIKMWMAQGFLNSTDDPVYTGEKYFADLVDRSFFYEFFLDKDDNESSIIISCKMHELMHETYGHNTPPT